MINKKVSDGKRKFNLKGKIKHIVVLCIMTVIAIALIVGDVFAYSYAPIISGFFGSNEQISGDSAAIEEAAKSGRRTCSQTCQRRRGADEERQ